MKEFTEKIIILDPQIEPSEVVGKIEKTAEQMFSQGWFFVSAQTNALVGELIIFFERDVHVE